MLSTPFVRWPSFSETKINAVTRVMQSSRVNYWMDNECREFEREYAVECGSAHAVALVKGTLALNLTLNTFGIGQGDKVVVTPRTFFASVSCVVNTGATSAFAEVE
jgi:dTDP-4-amino-4,6-dideoxygalactose transaminase